MRKNPAHIRQPTSNMKTREFQEDEVGLRVNCGCFLWESFPFLQPKAKGNGNHTTF